MRELLARTYHEALTAASPGRLVRAELPGSRPDFVLAVGKAALSMLRAALEAHPGAPFLAVPPDGAPGELPPGAHGEIVPGAHPLPDERSVRAAELALARLGELRADQEALVLLSGGGSALLSAPWGVTLAQKQTLTRDLMRAGADIQELNAVRKHLSRVKGGRLAQSTRARVRSLLLSDVIGDDPATIASGPTAPDPSTFRDALEVLERYGIHAPEARAHLQRGVSGELPETLKAGDPDAGRLQLRVIGSNFTLLSAARAYLEGQGYRVMILSDRFGGEARHLAHAHAAIVHSVREHGAPTAPRVFLLSGGEATVTVRGDGVGGRNQEFALWLLAQVREAGVWALSAGSDGIDGTSPAAGAYLTPDSWARARALGLDADVYLARNDSGTFFEALGDQLITGPTGHNLNDLRVIAVTD